MVNKNLKLSLASVLLLGFAVGGCSILDHGAHKVDSQAYDDGMREYNYPEGYEESDQGMIGDEVVPVSTSLIYFKFDSSALSTVSRGVLDKIIVAMRSNVASRLRIDGHTDERGTEDYNLALGYRRADAARQYIISCDPSLGSRIDIMSYGKTRLAVIGTRPEDAQLNRRDVLTLKIMSGESMDRGDDAYSDDMKQYDDHDDHDDRDDRDSYSSSW